MCQYQVLYHDDKTGYAVRCTECEKIQVAWGNLLMTFILEDFDDFHLWIRKINSEQQAKQDPRVRCIMIQAPCQGIQLLVSSTELAELVTLLECSDTELQSLQLISLFNE
jgi:hypothetical protein